MEKISKCTLCKDIIISTSRRCSPCNKIYMKAYNLKNKAKLKKLSNVYRQKNKEKIKRKKKEYVSKNKDLIYLKRLFWVHYNRKKINKYYRNKYKKNIEHKLKVSFRNRLGKLIKHKINSKTLLKTLGCTITDLISHIESKFKSEMTWDNYGKWHIDHIVPLFIAKNKKEIIELNHYTNLQPLWARDNLTKNKTTNKNITYARKQRKAKICQK